MCEEFKGTPGRWQVIESPLHGLIVIQEDSLDEGTGCISYTQISSEFQCEEDANLIAAAPDLLKALQLAMKVMEAMAPTESEARKIAIYAAGNAIADALGE